MTLLMFAHPMCPCTRASLAELNKLMQRVGDNVDAKVVFVIPAGAPAGWDSTKSWGIARAVPHTSVVADQDAALAKQFGATTSGDVLLYARDRTLLFHGGITGARGHEGDNAGEARILALARGEKAELATAPVFGCALDDPDNDGKAPK